MTKILSKQLSIDYCCSLEQVCDHKNHFSIYTPQENRRKFQEGTECFLKIAAYHGKLLFTGRKDIIAFCAKKYKDASGEWFLEAKNLVQLEKDCSQFGFHLEQVHPFFVAEEKSIVEPNEFTLVYYRGAELEQFRDDDRFQEAFAFCADAPDELGIAAYKDGSILGMAGASSDSPYLWQIGIDVIPAYRNRHIGTILVTEIKNTLLDMGKLPYYGTAISHIASQRTAIRAGFLPAWTELITATRSN